GRSLQNAPPGFGPALRQHVILRGHAHISTPIELTKRFSCQRCGAIVGQEIEKAGEVSAGFLRCDPRRSEKLAQKGQFLVLSTNWFLAIQGIMARSLAPTSSI